MPAMRLSHINDACKPLRYAVRHIHAGLTGKTTS